jgi:hypothetical protein
MFTNHAGESTTIAPPRGHWKGGIFGCCNDGICSAYLCCSLWCTNCKYEVFSKAMAIESLTYLTDFDSPLNDVSV